MFPYFVPMADVQQTQANYEVARRMQNDGIVAELRVMFPNTSVMAIHECLRSARNHLSEMGTLLPDRDLLFNFCVDQLLALGVSNDTDANPSASHVSRQRKMQAVAMKLATRRAAPPGRSQPQDGLWDDGGPAPKVPRNPPNLITLDDNNEPQASNAVKADEPLRFRDPVIKDTTRSTPSPLIDPEKRLANVDDAEMDFYVAYVREMFPKTDPVWIRDQFVNGLNINHIVDQHMTRPGFVPKEPKKTKRNDSNKSTVDTPTNVQAQPLKNYFNDYAAVPNEAYVSCATNLILEEFKQVRFTSLLQVLKFVNNHYAPAAKIIHDTLKDKNLREYKGRSVIIEIVPPPIPGSRAGIPHSLQINMSTRPRRKFPLVVPDDLQAELDWLKDHIDDDVVISAYVDDESLPSTSNVRGAFGEPSGSKVADLSGSGGAERELIRQEAQLRGELYECVICCDDHVITEMVPCIDGHLFCRDCLRNHAREIVYGQAKAQISCLETDCKAGFATETLKNALDPEWLEKLYERMREEDINRADIENLVRCKYCNFAAVVDVPVEQDKVFKCPNPDCEKSVCRLCQVDWDEHIGLRCEELETKDETKLRKQVEEKMADAVIRTCSRCKAKLIKYEGCNKLECRCGNKMCYICRVANIDYSHFCTHARNPGQGCTQCKKCSLWQSAEIVDKSNLERIRQEAKLAQETTGLRAAQIGASDDNPSTATADIRNNNNNNGVGRGGHVQFDIPNHHRQFLQFAAAIPNWAPNLAAAQHPNPNHQRHHQQHYRHVQQFHQQPAVVDWAHAPLAMFPPPPPPVYVELAIQRQAPAAQPIAAAQQPHQQQNNQAQPAAPAAYFGNNGAGNHGNAGYHGNLAGAAGPVADVLNQAYRGPPPPRDNNYNYRNRYNNNNNNNVGPRYQQNRGDQR